MSASRVSRHIKAQCSRVPVCLGSWAVHVLCWRQGRAGLGAMGAWELPGPTPGVLMSMRAFAHPLSRISSPHSPAPHSPLSRQLTTRLLCPGVGASPVRRASHGVYVPSTSHLHLPPSPSPSPSPSPAGALCRVCEEPLHFPSSRPIFPDWQATFSFAQRYVSWSF